MIRQNIFTPANLQRFNEQSCALLNTKRDHNRECLRSLAVLKRVYSNEKDQITCPRENKRSSTQRRGKHFQRREYSRGTNPECIIILGNDHCANSIFGTRNHRVRWRIYFFPGVQYLYKCSLTYIPFCSLSLSLSPCPRTLPRHRRIAHARSAFRHLKIYPTGN